jgi:hypothetical protein
LNQGVQGGSYIFHHTMTMFARQGHYADPVKLQVRSRYVFELVPPTDELLRCRSIKGRHFGPMFSLRS